MSSGILREGADFSHPSLGERLALGAVQQLPAEIHRGGKNPNGAKTLPPGPANPQPFLPVTRLSSSQTTEGKTRRQWGREVVSSGVPEIWVHTLDVIIVSCATLYRWLKLSKPQFLICKMGMMMIMPGGFLS